MSKARYGLLAGIAGAAFAAWWWNRREQAIQESRPARGELIFSNAPIASESLGG